MYDWMCLCDVLMYLVKCIVLFKVQDSNMYYVIEVNGQTYTLIHITKHTNRVTM